MREARGRHNAHAAGLVVLHRLDDLLARVHDEGAVARDRFADRPAAQEQHLPAVLRSLRLALGRAYYQCLTFAEDRQLAFGQRPLLASGEAVSGKHVGERVEVARPGNAEA